MRQPAIFEKAQWKSDGERVQRHYPQSVLRQTLFITVSIVFFNLRKQLGNTVLDAEFDCRAMAAQQIAKPFAGYKLQRASAPPQDCHASSFIQSTPQEGRREKKKKRGRREEAKARKYNLSLMQLDESSLAG